MFADDQVQELPPPAKPAPLHCPVRELEGDDLAPTLPALALLAGEIGSAVSFETIAGGARGFYEPSTKRIAVETDMAVNQQAATLMHELAHALVRADRQAGDPELDYPTEELVAESVAFTVVRSVGIDTDARSIPYLASWAEASDITAIEKVAALIDRLARRIETSLHTHDDDESEAPEVGERAAA